MISDSASTTRWRSVSGDVSILRQMTGSAPASLYWLAMASKPFAISQSQRVGVAAMAIWSSIQAL